MPKYSSWYYIAVGIHRKLETVGTQSKSSDMKRKNTQTFSAGVEVPTFFEMF